jgi:cystathionine beta-lyase/cystathionine gamma-synthase
VIYYFLGENEQRFKKSWVLEYIMALRSLQDILSSTFFSKQWHEFSDNILRKACPFDTRKNFQQGIHRKKIPPVQEITFPFTSIDHFDSILKHGPKGHYYSRLGSPLEDELCRRLVHAEASYVSNQDNLSASIFSSGMAAITTIVHAFQNALHNFKKDDLHFLVDEQIYADTHLLFEEYVPTLGFGNSIFVDFTKRDRVETILTYNSKNILALFYQPLSMPYLKETKTVDMREITNWHGRIPLIVDTTLIPPHLQQQFRLGSDLVVYSLSKYVDGQGKYNGGAVIGPVQFTDYVRRLQRVLGNIPSQDAMASFCTGLETLPERCDIHIKNTLTFSDYLENHKEVEKVYYPPYSGVIAGASPGGVFSFRFAGKHAQEKVQRTERLMEFLIEHDHIPIANQVGFGSVKHAMLIQTPYRQDKGDPGLVRFAVGRNPSAKEVIPFLEKALNYACKKS